MNRSRILFHMVRADFLERIRRYNFLLALLFSVYLGYAVYAGQIRLQLDSYTGVPNSAWLGSVVTLVGSVFLSLIGFYVVKNSIQRDRETRVGRILAATPISGSFYTLSKALSNFAVLALMILVLASAAIVIQLTHKTTGPFNLFALLSPILLFSLCAMGVTSALAVLFETIPGLRGGIGNIAYFFLWTFLLSMSVTTLVSGKPQRPLNSINDYSGIATISGQMQAQIHQLDPQYKGGSSFKIGTDHPATKTFLWNGLRLTPIVLLSRLSWLAIALSLALLAASIFDRFDPAREIVSFKRVKQKPSPLNPLEAAQPPLVARHPQLTVSSLTPVVRSAARNRFFTLVLAELRLLLRGREWWWYLVAAGLFVASLASPLPAVRSGLIVAAWIWPALLWSQLGTREAQFSTRALIFSAPNAFPRQLLSSWIAGVLLALLTGGGLALRLLLTHDLHALLTLAAGALFIPALALTLGVLTESRKPFEAVYTLWWYIGPLHHVRNFDFIGTTLESSTPILFLALSAALLLVALSWRKVRLAHA